MIRNNLRRDALQGTKQISTIFETNSELLAMMKPFSQEFRDTYKVAYEEFIRGEWGKAKVKF